MKFSLTFSVKTILHQLIWLHHFTCQNNFYTIWTTRQQLLCFIRFFSCDSLSHCRVKHAVLPLNAPKFKKDSRPTDLGKSFFFSSPCIKHHYIFITQRQMTKQERREEPASNSTACLVSLCRTFDCGAFHLQSPPRTQFYKQLQNGLLIWWRAL